MNSQGIQGPPYEFIHGNNREATKLRSEAVSKPMPALRHDIFPRVLPQFYTWKNKYGKNFLCWDRTRAQLVIGEPELVKEVFINSEGAFPKTKADTNKFVHKILGDGLTATEGEKWVRQRKLANHAFHGERLKNMIPAIIASVETMLGKWKDREGKEIEVFQEYRLLTSEVISRTAFGRSYLEGEKIFQMLMKLTILAARNFFKLRLPGISMIWKTADEKESEKLAKGIHDCVMDMVKEREEKVANREADNFGIYINAKYEVSDVAYHLLSCSNYIFLQDIFKGIKGPPYKFIHGNNKEATKLRNEAFSKPIPSLTHDIFPRVMPQFYSPMKLYGKNYLMWVGVQAQLVIGEPELVKEIVRNSEGGFPKRKDNEFMYKILGEGLVATQGEKWVRQRKLANHAFHGESLKNMFPAVIASVETMLGKWKGCEGKEIEVFEEFRNYFNVRLPIISKIWKTEDEKESEKLARGIHECVMDMVKKREEKVATGEADSFGTLLKFLHKYWWLPIRTQYIMNSQGIRGPPYEFIHGNNRESTQLRSEAFSKPMPALTHDIFPRVQPQFHLWMNRYGKNYLSWDGVQPQLVIGESELVKEVLKNSEGDFPKRKDDNFVHKILGDGLVTSEGEKWVRQRKLANHAFHGESLKNMIPAVIASVETMLEKWKGREGKEIEVFEEFRNFFKVRLPGGIRKIWKTADEKESEELAKGIHDFVMDIVKKREEKVATREVDSFGSDFLGLLINAYHDSDEKNRLSEQDLVDECKTFYFAGHETTNTLLTWTTLMLAIHTDWQEKARKEVIEGIKGPRYEFIHGSNKAAAKLRNEAFSKPMALTHDIVPRALPQIHTWINKYGKNYLNWQGVEAQLVITEPELVKEVLKTSEEAFPKREPRKYFKDILGDGLVTSNGKKWAKQRKLANHAFHGESLKNMIPAVVSSVETMLERWKDKEGKEIEVYHEFKLLTSEIISRTAFGSSYLEGEKIFESLMKLKVIAARSLLKAIIPGLSKIWKTADDIESEKLVKGIHDSVMQMLKKREEKVANGEANSFGTDFLGLLVNSYHDADEENRLSLQDVVDECKTFYIAGHETANSLLGWLLLVLSIHTDWQEKARQEVIEVFGDQNPNSEGIAKLKTYKLNSQGIKGPAYEFIHGNNKAAMKFRKGALSKPMALRHDIFPRVFPQFYTWKKLYGKNFLTWNGVRAQVVITEPELIKEVLKDSEKAFPKRKVTYFLGKIIGDGLATTIKSEKWARQRKLANHAFHGESLKNMTPAVIASVETMLDKWKELEGKEIEVFEKFRLLTSEVISRTAFGSSYLEGEKIFETLMKLAAISSRNIYKVKIPVISEFWKSADEIEAEKLEKEIYDSVMKIVKKREEKVGSGKVESFGSDFLGLLLKSYHNSDEKNRVSVQDLVDECKTFYFAGQETTNSLLAWTSFVLAIHTDWQEKARKEVIEMFGNQNPDPEGISKLKIKKINTMEKLLILVASSFCLCFLLAVFSLLYKYWWVPYRIQYKLNSQGIKGPAYEFIHGNNKSTLKFKKEASSKPMALTHDIFPRVFPHTYSWMKLYGKNFLAWNGTRAQLVITEPELIKENMNPAVIASVETMVGKWKEQEGKEIEVFKQYRLLTSEVISRTAFGSSYLEGEKIFETLMKLSVIAGRNFFKAKIPVISEFWKSADEIEAEKLEKEIYDSVMRIVKKREEKVASGEAESFGSDFLGLLLKAYHDSDEKNRLSIQDLVDECKTFYFAGQETTNSLLAWTSFVLAIHTDWQEKARKEVIEMFGNQNPDPDGISKLKIVSIL
ncbi:Cytochrome P450 [Corchorus olitorius]|uniref:Cytochrome P450 n=1 Tax=Corchorus olitorius TaxID=93759 RepID=A0A1R3HPA5_9ROSI|nr:Cytochrome P450 [Corchorus olitorius]